MKKITAMAAMIAALFVSNCTIDAPVDPGTTTSGCTSTPSPVGLTASSSTSVSHRFGEDCMNCHNTTSPVFTVAGSMASTNGGTSPVAAGATITGVGTGNVTMTVDTCGNFYTTLSVGTLNTSTPTTTAAAAPMGGGSWNNNASDGSCNQTGCHDVAAGAQPLVY